MNMSDGDIQGRRREAMQFARRDEHLGFQVGFKGLLRVLSTLSRVYLSGGSGEFSNFWSECWVLSVIMVLSYWSFNCSWFPGLAEGHLGMSLKCGSFQTNVMSIDRRAVFKEHVNVAVIQRTSSSHF